MATATSSIRKVDYAKRQEQFNKETKPEMEKQLNALIDKIGYVNVVILLEAINEMKVVDINTPYKDKDYRNGWFVLKGITQNQPIKGITEYASSVGVFVDDKLQWRERWLDILGTIQFGNK